MVFDRCFLVGKGRVLAPRGAAAQDGGGGGDARSAASNVSPTASVLSRGDEGATAQAAATARASTKCLRVMFDYRTWPARRTHRFPSVAGSVSYEADRSLRPHTRGYQTVCKTCPPRTRFATTVS